MTKSNADPVEEWLYRSAPLLLVPNNLPHVTQGYLSQAHEIIRLQHEALREIGNLVGGPVSAWKGTHEKEMRQMLDGASLKVIEALTAVTRLIEGKRE